MGEFLAGAERIFTSIEERMRLVITLSRLNIEHKTGGPFGAAVFEQESGKLIAAGVNIVIAANCSIAHAEIMAISIAQQMLGHYDLSSEGMPSAAGYELVTSTAPCAMCLGAIPWSGVQRVICGARDEDARSIGFDEGAKPQDWVSSLESRGITVIQDVLREEALNILSQYRDSGGVIY
jgi:tRNA(Arg) A34 adenosine deaminase TadA